MSKLSPQMLAQFWDQAQELRKGPTTFGRPFGVSGPIWTITTPDGASARLSPKQAQLLIELAKAWPLTRSRAQLASALWGAKLPDNRAYWRISQIMNKLRRSLPFPQIFDMGGSPEKIAYGQGQGSKPIEPRMATSKLSLVYPLIIVLRAEDSQVLGRFEPNWRRRHSEPSGAKLRNPLL